MQLRASGAGLLWAIDAYTVALAPLLAPASLASIFARICFDHLAGRVAVSVVDGLIERGAIATGPPDPLGDVVWTTGPDAGAVFGELGVRAELVVQRCALYPCLDWSVRRPHLSGAIGAELLEVMLRRDWLRQVPGRRAVVLTEGGATGLHDVLGVQPEPVRSRAGR